MNRCFASLAWFTLAAGFVDVQARAQCQPSWSPALAAAGLDGGVNALRVLPEGAGQALYVGGRFVHAGGVEVNQIARYDGQTWLALGSGIPGQFNSHGLQGCCAAVKAISGELGAGGLTVRVAGNFIEAGGAVVESIAEYSGGKWASVGGGVARTGCVDCAYVVEAMARFGDPGIGPLYAAGNFDLAGGVAASRIARWDGSAWSPLGSGVGSAPGDPFPSDARAMAAFGTSLFVVGAFTRAGTVLTTDIARWDGVAWSDVGGGIQMEPGGRTPSLSAAAVFDDGSGAALYVAGIIDRAGGMATRNIARWNGSSWSAVGGGIGSDVNDRIWVLSVFDDGTGPALYAGGQFADAGGNPALNVAKWDGRSWSALGSGVDGEVFALEPFDDGTGPGLFVGGYFSSAGGIISPNLAKWAGCAACYANCDGSSAPPVLNINDFVCFQSSFAAGDPYANCDNSTLPPVLNINDFICFQQRFAVGCR